MLFLAFVAVILVYELVLGLTVPPNNGDALGYHLAKVAAWAQHHAYYWIPDAPTVRINAFRSPSSSCSSCSSRPEAAR